MKTAINAWSFRPEADFEECFREAKAAGFDGVEFNLDREDKLGPHSLSLETSDEVLDSIAALSNKYALPVVSVSCSAWKMGDTPVMGLATPESIDYSRRLLDRQLYFATVLGAGGILTNPGGVDENDSLALTFDNCIKTLRKARDITEKYTVRVGLENVWNHMFMSAYDMIYFLDKLGDPKVGAYLDLGNVIEFSRPEDWVEILGDRITNIHIKGYKRNCGYNSGGVWCGIGECGYNWKRVKLALDRIGFDGYLTAEVSKSDDSQSWQDFYRSVCKEINEIINS